MSKTKNRVLGRQLLSEHRTFKYNTPVYIPLFLADKKQKIQMVWEIELENGQREAGKVKRNRLNLPAGLPIGKHIITLIAGKWLLDQGYKIYSCQLEITP